MIWHKGYRNKKTFVALTFSIFFILTALILLWGCAGKKTIPADPKKPGTPAVSPDTTKDPATYDVLIVKSPASLNFFGWRGEKELESAGDTLHRLGVKYAYIPEDQLSGGEYPCRILLLPNSRCMSAEAYEGIRKFAKSGGKVMATYMAGYRDENNQQSGPVNNYLLSDIYGVDFASWVQGKPHCGHLVPGQGDRIQLGRNQGMLIKPHQGTQVLARWEGGSDSPSEGTPAVTYNPDNGAIYMGEDLFAPENSGSAQVVAYVGSLIEMLAPGAVKNRITGDEGWIAPGFEIPDEIINTVKPGGSEIIVGLKDPFDGVSLTCSGDGSFSGGSRLSGVTLSGDGNAIEEGIPALKSAGGSRYQVRGVTVVGKDPYIAVYSSSGQILARCRGPLTFKPDKAGDPVILYDQNSNGTYSYRAFRGWIRFYPARSGRLLVNNYLTMEEYLAGVVPSEMPASYPGEALKAMAVTARTFAGSLVESSKHKDDGFHVCDQIHCQVYQGIIKERKFSNDAISQTRGVVATFRGKYPNTTFHATNGGFGARASSVWGGDEPYLMGGFDGPGQYDQDLSVEENLKEFIDNPPETYDSRAGRFRWTQTYTKDELRPMISEALGVLLGRGRPKEIGKLYSVRITSRARDGRAQVMEIVASEGTYQLKKDQMRWITSGGKISTGGLQSTLFYVKEEGEKITFAGGGWGHGVGLSQEGARGRAHAGQKYDQILEHYYRGIDLEKKY